MTTAPTARMFDLDGAPGADRGLWYRVSSSAVMVGVGIGWTSAIVACCLAAPLSLALHGGDESGDQFVHVFLGLMSV